MADGHFRNASWGGFVAATKAGTGLISALLAVRLLGAEQFGLVATLLSLFVLFLSLISSAFTVLVVKLYSTGGENQQLEREVLTVAALRLCMSAVAFLAIVAAMINLVATLTSKVPESYLNLIPVMCLLTAIQIIVALNASVIEGAGRLDLAAKWQLTGPLLVLAGLSYFYIKGDVLLPEIYLFILCAAALIDMGMTWWTRRRLGLIFVSNSVGHPIGVLKLLRSGGLLQLTSLLNLFLEPVNKSLLNHFSGSASVAVYDLTMKVVWGIQHLVGAAMRVFLHIGCQDRAAVGVAFAKVLALLCVPVLGMHVLGALFLSWLAHYWVEVDSSQLMIFFAVATLSNLGMIFVTPLYLSLIGANDLFFIFRSQALLALVNVLVSSAAIPMLGLIGAAFGLLVATLINAVSIYRRCKVDLNVFVILNDPATYVRLRLIAVLSLLVFTVVWAVLGGAQPIVFGFVVVALAISMAAEPLVAKILMKIKSKNPKLDL